MLFPSSVPAFIPHCRRVASSCALLLLVSWLAAAPALAHEGHDHDEPGSAAAAAILRPDGAMRQVLELTSESFEVLIEAQGDHLDIWLDRYDTNEPVRGAALELTLGEGPGIAAIETQPGQYTVDIKPLAADSVTPVTLTVSVGDEVDLLGGTLELPAVESPSMSARLFERIGGWWSAVLGLLLAAGIAVALRLRARRARTGLMGSATGVLLAGLCSVAAITTLLTGAGPAAAHEGHDHADETPVVPASAGSNRPMRLPDGSVFVPKATQRILELRTQRVVEGDSPVSLRLAGEIVGDPRASATLQTLQGGRVLAASGRWPVLGARVRRGEVLLQLTPSGSAGERASGAAEVARVAAELVQAETGLARLEGLPGVVARAEVEAVRSQLQSLRVQREALSRSTAVGGESIVSPLDGVIAAIEARPGAVVAPGDSLISVIDPARLSVAALAFEPVDAAGIRAATVALRDGTSLQARVEGVGAELKGGAVPVRLNLQGVAPGLVVGQPVVVYLERSVTAAGLSLPVASVVRLPNGERVVFEKVAAERFVPRSVRTRPISADRIVVLAGLASDARVVVGGAALIAQIR